MRSTIPCSIGLQACPKRCLLPMSAVNSARRQFLNSGPRSLLIIWGNVPDRKIHLASALLTCECPSASIGSNNAAWHKHHTYTKVYLLPRLSAGLDGPSQSTITSSQASQSKGITAFASCLVGRRLNLKHVMQFSTHFSTSLRSPGHAATRDKMSIV